MLRSRLMGLMKRPPLECAYPLLGDNSVRDFVGANVTLVGAGDGNRTVTWAATGSNTAIASHADAEGVGAITMGADPVWIEAIVDGVGSSYFYASLVARLVDGGSLSLGKAVSASSSSFEYGPMVFTLGLYPDGSYVSKRNGAVVDSGGGKFVTGDKFTPYIHFYLPMSGQTATATLIANHDDMLYADAGVGICLS